MEWIASLDFEKIANAIIILLVGFLGAFGFRSGKKSGPSSNATASPHVEIAGALVDATSIKHLSAAVEGHSLALVETRAHGRDVIAAVNGLGDALDRHREEVGDLKEQMRELRQEMSFRRKG